jgi:hypothetical protein
MFGSMLTLLRIDEGGRKENHVTDCFTPRCDRLAWVRDNQLSRLGDAELQGTSKVFFTFCCLHFPDY